MNDDLLDLIGTVNALDRLAKFAPHSWPPAARQISALLRGLTDNVAGVRATIANQDALIKALQADAVRMCWEIAELRTALGREHQN